MGCVGRLSWKGLGGLSGWWMLLGGGVKSTTVFGDDYCVLVVRHGLEPTGSSENVEGTQQLEMVVAALLAIMKYEA